ncbi:MAG: response regulator [Polyangiales bacterium]
MSQVVTPSPSPPQVKPLQARILLVDDHPPNLVALDAILESLGQELVRATSGEEALKHLLNGDFACILMDVQMPGLDGFQTATMIRARPRTRGVPIIFLTAYSKEPSHVFRGYRTGAVDYLVKPFDPDVLRSKVSVFVDLHLAREQVKLQAELLLQREREAHERASNFRYQQLIDTMPLAVWGTRSDGEVYLVNRFLADYTGLGDASSTATLVENVHPDDRAPFVEALSRAQKEGKPLEVEYRMRRHADGAYRWFLGRAVAERDALGGVAGCIGTATDIEDHKRDQVALKQASEAKDEFIAAASHELRTPLAAAKAQSQLARRRLGGTSDPKATQALDVIERQVDRITKLVEDLLDLSRLQTGRISLDLRKFDFTERLRESVERMQALTEKHQLEARVDTEIAVVGDQDRLEQVLTNLLANAIRYSPAGGPIHAALVDEGAAVHLTVRDTGLGIPHEKQADIFERFARAHGTKYGGLGLGLAITRGIVQQHGGKIWVESSGVPGEGSTFHVSLPKQPPPESRANDDDDEDGRTGDRPAAGSPPTPA